MHSLRPTFSVCVMGIINLLEKKNARYKAALKRFSQEWADHDMSARAMYRHADVLRGEGELVEAHKMAKRGISIFPESVGAKECRNLIYQIEAKSSLVKTERVWNAPFPKINCVTEI